jgi:hypothetical protein
LKNGAIKLMFVKKKEIMLLRQINKLEEENETLKTSYSTSSGPFETKLDAKLDFHGIEENKMLTGENAYKFFEKGADIATCLEPQAFTNQNNTEIIIGSVLIHNITTSWVIKMEELIQTIPISNGSWCKHDFQKAKIILTDLGNIYHLLVKKKVRPSGHQRLGHLFEYAEHHGGIFASERVGELAHQPVKRAVSDTVYVRRGERMQTILALAYETIQKYECDLKKSTRK